MTVLALLALALALLPAWLALANLLALRGKPGAPVPDGLVSILIPARNEAGNIGPTLAAALASTGVPIEVIVRNVAAGSLSKKLGIEEGTQLPRTLIEYCYKDDALGDPLVSEEHIACFGWATQEEMHDIADMAIRVNDFLCGLFAGIGIRLIDFKLEFGRLYDGDYSRIILADEISPDGCRLWDMATNEKLDKDRFRRDLGGEVEAYQEVARRLGLLPEGLDTTVLDLDTHRKKREKE